jgi:hypothetical protein
MIQFLIDDRGDLWGADSIESRRHLGIGREIAQYAVAQLGWVRYLEDRGKVSICLDPAKTSRLAVDRAMKYARGTSADRVRLKLRVGGTWRNETLPLGSVAAFIEGLRERTYSPSEPRFAAIERPLQSIWAHRQKTLLLHFQQFASESRRWTVDDAVAVALMSPRNQNGLVEMTTDSSYRWRKVNGLMSYYSVMQGPSMLGRDIRESIDPKYSSWCVENFARVAAEGRPAVQDVDAVISMPNKSRIKAKYRRLVIPMSTTGKTKLLAVCSEVLAEPISLIGT